MRHAGLLKVNSKKKEKGESERGRGQEAAASGELGWEGPNLATKKKTNVFNTAGQPRGGDPNDQALMLLAERKFR